MNLRINIQAYFRAKPLSYADALWVRHATFLLRSWGRKIAWRACPSLVNVINECANGYWSNALQSLRLISWRWRHMKKIHGGYYTAARYEFYVRVARTISHEWPKRTSKILFLPREHKIHIFKLTCNLLFIILCRHTDDGAFDDFPKISDHFPKISENSLKFARRSHERCRTFFEIFRRLTKISEDCRRLSRNTRRCFDHTPTNLSTT